MHFAVPNSLIYAHCTSCAEYLAKLVLVVVEEFVENKRPEIVDATPGPNIEITVLAVRLLD
ncbi:hypothetical protein HOD41_01460 [bacterium]|nr:hypothetical protein [bacterium]MBT7311836.1 hypothetical protein [bacterium]